MGRKIIFDLADIKRHCISSSCSGSVFIGNLKEKIKLDDRRKAQDKITGSGSEKCHIRKRKGKEPKRPKKKKRVSSSSFGDTTSDQESTKRVGKTENGLIDFSEHSGEQSKNVGNGAGGARNGVGDSGDSTEQSESSGTESSDASSSEEDSS
ncbi:unnamed protein product [Oikopleura dioica]|uniref:Uncharacterized protein n=1 Tax=Oikopleura dioica TaxID=34765 RepID=E4Y1G6_OIKDI|nr:unnamed protein product [Oikopleura dioica]